MSWVIWRTPLTSPNSFHFSAVTSKLVRWSIWYKQRGQLSQRSKYNNCWCGATWVPFRSTFGFTFGTWHPCPRKCRPGSRNLYKKYVATFLARWSKATPASKQLTTFLFWLHTRVPVAHRPTLPLACMLHASLSMIPILLETLIAAQSETIRPASAFRSQFVRDLQISCNRVATFCLYSQPIKQLQGKQSDSLGSSL